MGRLMDISPPLLLDIKEDTPAEEKLEIILDCFKFKLEEMEKEIERFRRYSNETGSYESRSDLEGVRVAALNISQIVSIYTWEVELHSLHQDRKERGLE